MSKRFSIISRIYSFKHAFRGLRIFLSTQHNAWVQLFALVLVLAAGLYFRINAVEWIGIIFAAGLVFVAEVLNTSIEHLTDHVSPEYHQQAGKVKDLGAAAVLVAALVALVIGSIVFIPKIIG